MILLADHMLSREGRFMVGHGVLGQTLGSELVGDLSTLILQNSAGSSGVLDAANRTLVNGTSGTNNTFPRLRTTGVVNLGSTYQVAVSAIDPSGALNRAGVPGNYISSSDGLSVNQRVIEGTFVADGTPFMVQFDGTFVFTITDLTISLREVL